MNDTEGKLPYIRFTSEPGPQLYCPECGVTLREDFSRGQMRCGECDQVWTLEICMRSVNSVVNRAVGELIRLQATLLEEAIKRASGSGG